MSIDAKLSCITQIACGMEYLHSRGMGHSDLKAENVVLHKRPRSPCELLDTVYKLIDISDGNDSTISHMSPEHLNGHYNCLHCDVWSFHVVVWEVSDTLLTRSRFDQIQKLHFNSLITDSGTVRDNFLKNFDNFGQS